MSNGPRDRSRRQLLRAVAAGTLGGLAGCSDLVGSISDQSPTAEDGSTPRQTPSQRVTRSATPSNTTATTATPTPEPVTESDLQNLQYLSPQYQVRRYGEIIYDRKRAALEVVLGVPDVADLVTDAVSSTAYHRILDGIDYVEILAPHEMTVSPEGAIPGDSTDNQFYIARRNTVTFSDVKRIRALVARETDELLKLQVGSRPEHAITHTNYDGGPVRDLESAKVARDDPEVREHLRGKQWYLSFSGTSPYAAYSEDHPVGSLQIVGFDWNDREGDVVACHTILDRDAGEVLQVQAPTRSTPQPLEPIAEEFRGETGEPKFGRGPVEPPGDYIVPESGFEQASGTRRGDGWRANYEGYEATNGVVEKHDWTVEWRNTVHDGYAIEASYKGKPVFGPQTKIPYMKSDYEPFGMKAPGVPEGDRITYMFWDPLGITGPGVVEQHDLRRGFRIRGTFHTGASTRWEWRFGQNFGPYRYIVDWHFFADGSAMLISRHPTTGYRTTNGYPQYTYHVGVESGFDSATVSASPDEGETWEAVPTERKFDRTGSFRLRVENENGPERLVIPRAGGETYALKYDPAQIEYEDSSAGLSAEMNDREYLDPANYIQDRSLDGARPYLRLLTTKDTSDGPHATVDPWAFVYRFETENY